MKNRTAVTVIELQNALAEVPPNALVEIAIDPELNAGGPIATNKTGALMISETRLRKNDQPVIMFLPEFVEPWEDRYVE